MLLAAGRGLRLRPLTDTMPKALVEVAGRPLIDHALDHLTAAGVARAVVNAHHHADQLDCHLAGRRTPRVAISHEPTLLETGGGIVQALPLLGEGAFYAINTDALWRNVYSNVLLRLADTWEDAGMDALLALYPTVKVRSYRGVGDFACDALGRLRRRREREVTPFVYTGLQILHPRLFRDAPAGAFSLNRLYDRAEDAGRLYGLVHDGLWFEAGTPDTLAAARLALA